jgi:hypothetical protein
MKLQHIKQLVCSCGAEVCLESNSNKHSATGQNIEIREFECGYRLCYLPQFGRVGIEKECTNNRKYIMKKRKRILALKSLFREIRKLKVDMDFKEELVSALITKFVR